jgi:hypothetical protein
MDTVSASPRAGLPRALATFLFHHNPFYLLSALCMIAGCYMLNGDLALRAGELPRLLLLVATLNAYELLLIALGLYLIRGRGIERDGRTLLLLEAPFLVDLAFLNAEVAQTHGATALVLNALVFGLALLKVAAIFGVLYEQFPSRIFGFVATELLVLFGLPSVFRAVAHNGSPTTAQFFAAWLIVALLPVMYETQLWLAERMARHGVAGFAAPRRRFILHLYMTLPFVSLLAHLGMLHWVYNARFYLGEGTLVLLAVSLPLARMQVADAQARSLLATVRVALPAIALVMTLEDPVPLAMHIGGRTPLTPAMVIAAGAYVVYVYMYLRKHALYYIAAAASSSGMALFLQWGVAAVAAGFAFLGLGASISLRQQPEVVPPAGENS